MHLTILTKAPEIIDRSHIAAAAAVEASIVNHCIANLHFGMDPVRAGKLERVRQTAMDRYEVLMEMLR